MQECSGDDKELQWMPTFWFLHIFKKYIQLYAEVWCNKAKFKYLFIF